MTLTNNPSRGLGRTFGGLVLLSLAVSLLAVGVGYFPTRALAGPEAPRAMLLGTGIALLAALVGLVPPLLARPGRGPEFLRGLMAGMALRFVLTLALLLAALLSAPASKVVLALWVVIGYILLLALDTVALLRLGRDRAESAT